MLVAVRILIAWTMKMKLNEIAHNSSKTTAKILSLCKTIIDPALAITYLVWWWRRRREKKDLLAGSRPYGHRRDVHENTTPPLWVFPSGGEEGLVKATKNASAGKGSRFPKGEGKAVHNRTL